MTSEVAFAQNLWSTEICIHSMACSAIKSLTRLFFKDARRRDHLFSLVLSTPEPRDIAPFGVVIVLLIGITLKSVSQFYSKKPYAELHLSEVMFQGFIIIHCCQTKTNKIKKTKKRKLRKSKRMQLANQCLNLLLRRLKNPNGMKNL